MFLVGGVWEVLVHKYSRTSELPESCGGRSLKEVSWACLPVPACVGDLEQLPFFVGGVCVLLHSVSRSRTCFLSLFTSVTLVCRAL